MFQLGLIFCNTFFIAILNRIQIDFELSEWLVLPCLLLGALYAFVLYRKEKLFDGISMWLVRTMALFRFIVVSVLAILLLSPLLKTVFREVEKPIIIVAQDNSESLLANKDSAFYKEEYTKQLEELSERLADRYEIRKFTFGDKISEGMELNFSEKQTDISGFFDEMYNVFSNRNVGAIVFGSDGLFNKGSSPLYSSEKFKVPVYTIALGDTNVRKDIILTKVNHNKFAYLGNKFPLEITVDARHCKGKTTTLTISNDEGTVFTSVVDITGNMFTTTIPVQLEAKKPGLQRYRISLSSTEGELSMTNNQATVYIQVLDGRQKILILGYTPHPDIAALKQSIEANENYEVELMLHDKRQKKFDAYNLVIFHQLPANTSAAQKLITEINESNVPMMFILGEQSALATFNQLKMGVEIISGNNTGNEAQASFDRGFSLFTVSEELKRQISKYPPLNCSFGDYKTSGAANVLFNQKIGLVETQNPLLLFSQSGEKKIAVLTGEGLWKWRMNNFSVFGNHLLFDELVSKVVQYLSVKTDKSLFRIITRNHYLENEQILFDAELYNESYELINEPEVSIDIINSQNKNFTFAFNKVSKTYRLNAGVFPAGDYKYVAKVKTGEKMLTTNGSFSVSALYVESTNTVADHQLLFHLSEKSGASMFYPGQLNALADNLLSRDDIKSISYTQQKLKDAINLKWIFFIIILLLAAEWFIRKRNGAF